MSRSSIGSDKLLVSEKKMKYLGRKESRKMEKNGPLDQSSSVLKWIISFQSDYFVLVSQLSNLRTASGQGFKPYFTATRAKIYSQKEQNQQNLTYTTQVIGFKKKKRANVNLPMKQLELEWEPFHLLLSDSQWICLLFERTCFGNF